MPLGLPASALQPMTPKTDLPTGSRLARSWRLPTWAVLLGLLVLGGLLRFYQVGAIPPGLYQDEAYNGLDALDILAGSHPIYFPANNGREPFYMYLTAAGVAAFGRTPLAIRFPAAVVGTLLIAATFGLGRALYNQRVGLFAAAGVTITFWPLALSRIGLRAGSLPLFSALSLACAAWGWRQPAAGRRRTGWLILGGLFYGATFYTYLAARFTPVALFAFLIFWYIAARPNFPRLRELAAFGLPAVVVALPLALDSLWQPEILFSRVGQVSILSPTINHGDLWGTLFHNLLAAAGMFFVRGDTIARHNLPGRPVLDPLLGLAFVAGLALALVSAWRRKPAAALILIWTATLLLPTVLAEDTPHFLRAVGVLPVMFLLPALALEVVWQAAERAGAGWRAALPALILAGLAGSLAWTVHDYFGLYAHSADTAYLFQSAAAELAQSTDVYLQGGGRQVLMDQRFWDGFTSVRFLLPVQPGLALFQEGQALVPAGAPLTLVAWPYLDVHPALQALPAGALIRPQLGPLYRGDLETVAYPLYATYTVEPNCPAALCPSRPLADFGGAFQLLSAVTRPAPNGLRLELVWRGSHPDGAAHQVFAQAWVGGQIVAQADGPLGTALFPSEWWRPGETVWEARDFTWPVNTSRTGMAIRVGIYDVTSGIRVSRTDSTLDFVEITP
jgi:4-amino-4-deoxy-L-arabinose transferase-like glycosyltransferase